MALLVFAEERVDMVVLEVGLGGRLDATNVVIPELARHHAQWTSTTKPFSAAAWKPSPAKRPAF